MKDPFESSKFSIAWARDHIADLDREIKVFLNDENASAFSVEPDADGVYNLLKFKLFKPMPQALRGHTGDTAINLRAALDQVICSIFALKGLPTHTTYFPIGSSLAEFENTLNGRCKGLPKGISDIVRASRPYKGGNDTLWALNKLSGTNKHGILRPVALGHSLVEASGVGSRIQISCAPEWDGDKNEMVLARIPFNTEFEMNYKFALSIAFSQIEFIDGKEVIPVLNEFAGVVERVVMTIEVEARRIGLP